MDDQEYLRAAYPEYAHYDEIRVITTGGGFFRETGELIQEWWENITELFKSKTAREYTENNQGMSEDNFVETIQRFNVVPAKIIENPKKYVLYTIMIGKSSQNSGEPCVIQRRYSEFLELYTKLQHEFPAIFMPFPFPKKEVFGNFSDELMSFRSTRFESLLELIAQHEKVRESSSVLEFFQKKEHSKILENLTVSNYSEAALLLEFNFGFLNILLSDRHPKVLQALCLLVALYDAAGHGSRALHFVKKAVRRFESVSDTDSLRYYVPLLQLCVKLLKDSDSLSDSEAIEERLNCMKRRGIKVDGCPSLLDLVMPDFTSPETSS